MQKGKKWIAIALLVLIMAFFSPLIVENIQVSNNNAKLKQAMITIETDTVSLKRILPFEWDSVYTFQPYLPKEEMENILGFQSNNLKETVNEGMVQLVFVTGSKVVASVCGYEQDLGYEIVFEGNAQDPSRMITKREAIFSVAKVDGIIRLSPIEIKVYDKEIDRRLV